MTSIPASSQPLEKLADWQAALAEVWALETRLYEAMAACAATRGEPPRNLIIETERMREKAQQLFDVAVAAVDAQSSVRTGLTNFGELR